MDHIFLHDLVDTRRIFIVVTEVAPTGQHDPILGQKAIEYVSTGCSYIIGMPAVTYDHPYIIPIKRAEHNDVVPFRIAWDVLWL